MQCIGFQTGAGVRHSIAWGFCRYLWQSKKIGYSSDGDRILDINMTKEECALFYLMTGPPSETGVHPCAHAYYTNKKSIAVSGRADASVQGAPKFRKSSTETGWDNSNSINPFTKMSEATMYDQLYNPDAGATADLVRGCQKYWQELAMNKDTAPPMPKRPVAEMLTGILEADQLTSEGGITRDAFSKIIVHGHPKINAGEGAFHAVGWKSLSSGSFAGQDVAAAYTPTENFSFADFKGGIVPQSWGAMKSEDPQDPGYHLWGSEKQLFKIGNLDRPAGEWNAVQNSFVKQKKHKLAYCFGAPIWNAYGRHAIFRAFGKFADGSTDPSKAIDAQYEQAIHNMGIPFFTEGYPKGKTGVGALKPVPEYPTATISKKEKAERMANLIRNPLEADYKRDPLIYVSDSIPAYDLKMQQATNFAKSSTNGGVFEKYQEPIFKGFNFKSWMSHGAAPEGTGARDLVGKLQNKVDAQRAAEVSDMEEHKSGGNEADKALLEPFMANQGRIPRFKGIYNHFDKIAMISDTFCDAFNARLRAKSIGKVARDDDTSIGAHGMLKNYLWYASFATWQWHQWIKANNTIVYLWYALADQAAKKDKSPAELAEWAGKNREKVISAADAALAKEMEERRKAAAAAKARREAMDLANKRSAAADKAKEKQREREKFAGQCTLLGNLEKIKKQYREQNKSEIREKGNNLVHAGSAYSDRFYLLNHTGQEHSKIPSLLSLPKKDAVKMFTEVTPDIISALTPKIRLFKVFNQGAGDKYKEVEFIFENITNVDMNSFMDSAMDKGHGAGIKSFSFSFDGTTPATARKDIKAELVLYFQNFLDLTKKRKFTPNEEYSFVELLLFPSAPPKDQPNRHPYRYSAGDYKIRADVGWQSRNDDAFIQILNKRCALDPVFKDIKDPLTTFNDGLNKINKSFYLNMIDHDLDIKPDGTVEVKITYAAYIESTLRSSSLDALSTPESIAVKRLQDKKMRELITGGHCSDFDLNYIRGLFSKNQENFVKAQYQSIKRRLIQRQKVYHADVTSVHIRDFVNDGKMPVLGDGDIHIARNKFEYDLDQIEQMNKGDYKQKINFFFIGDLLHTILDCMYEPAGAVDEEYDPYGAGSISQGKMRSDVARTRLLLSSFVYDDYNSTPEDKKQKFNDINLSEIPVSFEYFQKWMTENVVEPDRKSYPVLDFIRDLCQMIINLFLETCINRQVDKSISLETGQILALATTTGNEPMAAMRSLSKGDKVKGNVPYMINVDKRHNSKDLPLNTSEYGTNIDDFWNYVFIYPVTSMNASTHTGKGKKHIDEEEGIYHYQIGSNRGLLKTVKFSKVDMQYIREARFFNHGHDGLMQLGAVYKATLNMIGNTLYYPGMELFIDPRGLGGPDFDPTIPQEVDKNDVIRREASIANALGIGGYHIVTKVKSTITPEKFETVVDAQFHYSGDGKASLIASTGEPTRISSDITDSGNKSDALCAGVVERATEAALAGKVPVFGFNVSDKNSPKSIAKKKPAEKTALQKAQEEFNEKYSVKPSDLKKKKGERSRQLKRRKRKYKKEYEAALKKLKEMQEAEKKKEDS